MMNVVSEEESINKEGDNDRFPAGWFSLVFEDDEDDSKIEFEKKDIGLRAVEF